MRLSLSSETLACHSVDDEYSCNWVCVCVCYLLRGSFATSPPAECGSLKPSRFLHRGVDPVVRRQHVHESGDPDGHAHRGRGRLPPFHVPAGVRPAHGRHVPRVGGHAEAGAGQREGQADGQPRYRISRPRWLRRSVFVSLSTPDSFSDLTHTQPVVVVCLRSCMNRF